MNFGWRSSVRFKSIIIEYSNIKWLRFNSSLDIVSPADN